MAESKLRNSRTIRKTFSSSTVQLTANSPFTLSVPIDSIAGYTPVAVAHWSVGNRSAIIVTGVTLSSSKVEILGYSTTSTSATPNVSVLYSSLGG